uniref:Uncharacterized protein n=1 Tax=Cannabis sativa TaxID=3483 RepID=A0A803Q8L9_CANSA
MDDEATKRREKLNFPRVLNEVAIKQDLPELIEFEDENSCNTTFAISYEWKPVICANCNGWKTKTENAIGVASTSNSFQLLEEKKNDHLIDESMNHSTEDKGKQVKEDDTGEGGFPSLNHGAWHKGGRIIVSWNLNSFIVNIVKCTSQMIHLFIETIDKKTKFFVTFVYGFNDEDGRKDLWRDLRDLNNGNAWMVLSDFNDILAKDERIGSRVRFTSSTAFRECVEDCSFEDVKFVGNFYTWCNK